MIFFILTLFLISILSTRNTVCVPRDDVIMFHDIPSYLIILVRFYIMPYDINLNFLIIITRN